MRKLKIFCFGFGQVAESFINKLFDEKKDLDLSITSRQETHQIELNNFKITSYQFNNEKFDKSIIKKLEEANFILISIPPIDSKDIVADFFNKNLIVIKNCKWITYLSATSVYGNHDGKWVDESSETKPTSINGIKRLKAENQWLQFSDKNKLPLQIFRLSGIYSIQNNILKRLIEGQAKLIKKENQFFSRIHLEDIANILFFSMDKFKTNEIYNISDDKPTSQEEIISYGSKLLKVKSPEILKLDDIEDGMLKDFYKDSKKVDNKKVKEFFNYKFTYPTYKEGLDSIFNNMV